MATKKQATRTLTLDDLLKSVQVSAEFKNPRGGVTYEDLSQDVDKLDQADIPAYLDQQNADRLVLKVYLNVQHDERDTEDNTKIVNGMKDYVQMLGEAYGFKGSVVDKQLHSKAGNVLLLMYRDKLSRVPSVHSDFTITL